MELDKNAGYLIGRLMENGFSAYAVGGCVRDMLLKKNLNDWDICTSALPSEIKEVFADLNCIDTGIAHGTVTVIYKKKSYEITTMRIEGEYVDNRHPENVFYVKNIEKDLARRDFTINAMAYNDRTGIIDLFNGAEDINKRIIRCVGDPDKRFSEDGLRIMRAIRFSSVLDFDIESKTAKSIHRNKQLLNNISAERIRDEFLKLICGVRATDVIREYLDVIAVFIPEIASMKGFLQNTPHHKYDVLEHTLKAMENIESDPFYKTVMFFHDISKPECHTTDDEGRSHFKGHEIKSAEAALNIMKRLRLPNSFTCRAVKLIKLHDTRTPADKRKVKHLMSKTGYNDLKALLKIQLADELAKSDYKIEEKIKRIEDVGRIADEIYVAGECFSKETMDIGGKDLMELGIRGKEIGQTLEFLFNAVLDENVQNKKEKLLEYLRRKSV